MREEKEGIHTPNKYFVAHLYESTGSYLCHYDLGVGLGVML